MSLITLISVVVFVILLNVARYCDRFAGLPGMTMTSAISTLPPLALAGLLMTSTALAAPSTSIRHKSVLPVRNTPETVIVKGRTHAAIRHERLQHAAASVSEIDAAKLDRLAITTTR